MKALVLNERQLRNLVSLDVEVVECIESAFLMLATKAVQMPPILRFDIPGHRAEVDVKTAYVPGLEGFAVKISSGFFDNPALGLPSTSGMMVLLSSLTGQVQAVLLDNGYLTDVRTAAAGAVAAKHLARQDSSVAAVLGGGRQARLQLESLALALPIMEARIWARDASKAEAAASELSARLGFPVAAHKEPSTAVAGAHVIVTATPAERPILDAAWLEPGQHVTAIGSDAAHKNEIDPAAIARADLYVADSLSQVRVLGELHHAIVEGVVPTASDFPELGEVIAGLKRGREDQSQITIADLTGTGVQDTAIATFAYMKAKAGTSAES